MLSTHISIKMHHVLDQFWTYNTTSKFLINKVPELQNIEQQWEIPLEGTDGIIKEKSSGEVLGLRQRRDCSYGDKVQPKTRGEGFRSCQATIAAEKWLRSKSDEQGWFTLKNLESGKLLSAIKKKKFKVTGTYILSYKSN